MSEIVQSTCLSHCVCWFDGWRVFFGGAFLSEIRDLSSKRDVLDTGKVGQIGIEHKALDDGRESGGQLKEDHECERERASVRTIVSVRE